MEKLDAATKESNLKEFAGDIAKPTEKMVRVRVVTPPGFWWGPTPRLHKLYVEGEELEVPEHVYLNSNYHNPKKAVNGMVVRGVLELADTPVPASNDGQSEDIRVLQERIRQLETERAVIMGAPVPTVVPDVAPAKKGAKPKKEEI